MVNIFTFLKTFDSFKGRGQQKFHFLSRLLRNVIVVFYENFCFFVSAKYLCDNTSSIKTFSLLWYLKSKIWGFLKALYEMPSNPSLHRLPFLLRHHFWTFLRVGVHKLLQRGCFEWAGKQQQGSHNLKTVMKLILDSRTEALNDDENSEKPLSLSNRRKSLGY